ncbi:MAG: hypothetical protein ABSG05_02185 [Candidatus Pacearchaeota archaeon]|jgi:hypothetical protein
MRILGFNFSKISVERLKGKQGELSVNSNIDIEDIEELKDNILKGEEKPIQIDFIYTVKYDPEIAKIDLKGTIILSLEEQQAKDTLRDWKKKKLPDEFRNVVFNIILRKATIKALELEDEMNLPTHMPMPVVSNENTEEKKEK